MRALIVTTTESADLSGNIPFGPNSSVVAINLGASSVNLQSSPTSGGTFSTISAVGANQAVELEIDEPFLQTSAGEVILLTN